MARLTALYRKRWVRIALTCALLLLVSVKVQPQRVGASLASANVLYVALALILTVPFLYLKALRWHLMLQTAGIRASFAEASISLIGGMGLALITPARLGELVRAAYLQDSRKWKIGGLVLLDKGFDVLVLTGLSIAGAWRLLGPLPGAALTAVTIIGVTALYRPVEVSAGLHAVSSRLPLRNKLETAWQSLEALSFRSTTLFLLLTLASFVVVLFQFGIILLSWHGWAFDIALLTFPLVILTNVLPLTIGGLGVREGAAALLLSHYGVNAADAAIAAFLMFCVNTALPGIIGATMLPVSGSRSAGVPVQSPDSP